MSYQNLSITLSPEEKAGIISKITELKALLPFLINLTLEERVNLRKVAEKRQGYLNDVLSIANANPSAIPAIISLQEMNRDTIAFHDLGDILAHLAPLTESLDDTRVALGNEAIKSADACYSFLKTAAKGNNALNTSVQQITKHFGQTRKPTEEVSE